MKINKFYSFELRINKRVSILLQKHEKVVHFAFILLTVYTIYYVYMYA